MIRNYGDEYFEDYRAGQKAIRDKKKKLREKRACKKNYEIKKLRKEVEECRKIKSIGKYILMDDELEVVRVITPKEVAKEKGVSGDKARYMLLQPKYDGYLVAPYEEDC